MFRETNMDKNIIENIAFWLDLIAKVLKFIAKGMPNAAAINTVAFDYGVDKETLKKMFEAYQKGELKEE